MNEEKEYTPHEHNCQWCSKRTWDFQVVDNAKQWDGKSDVLMVDRCGDYHTICSECLVNGATFTDIPEME